MLWTFIVGVYVFNIFLIPAYVYDILGFQTLMTTLAPFRIDFIFYIAIIVVIFAIVERRDIPGWFYEGEAQNLTRIAFFISALMMLPFLADNNFIYYMRLDPRDPFTEPFWFMFLNYPIYSYQISTLLDFIIGIAIWKFVDQWWQLPIGLMFLAAVYINLIVFLCGVGSLHIYIQMFIYFWVMIGCFAGGIYATINLKKRKYLLYKKSEMVERGWK